MVASVLVRYMVWHYTKAPTLLYRVWLNIVWYMGHLFSVGLLWRSLFSPWKRVVAKRTKRWDFEDMASAFIANIVSRLVGAIMRLTLIVVGMLTQLFALVCGVVIYLVWFFVPLLIGLTFMYGVMLVM